MTGTRMKIMALSILAMISLIGLSGAVADLTDLTLFVNEHVSLSASPGTSGGLYNYMWTASWPITEKGNPVNMLVSQNPLVFDAPDTAGEYTLKVLVSDQKAPENCKAEKTINLHVKKCCPVLLEDYCVEDKPTWCWYDSCTNPTGWSPAWVTEPSSIVFNWYVPSSATTVTSAGPCYAPNLKALPFTIPNSGTPTQPNSVRLDVNQTTTAHGGSSITLYSCTNTFNLHWVPVPSISLS